VKEASYYESRMSVLEGSAWHSPVDLPIHPVTRLHVSWSSSSEPILVRVMLDNDIML
jgi:hypothetical protein